MMEVFIIVMRGAAYSQYVNDDL